VGSSDCHKQSGTLDFYLKSSVNCKHSPVKLI